MLSVCPTAPATARPPLRVVPSALASRNLGCRAQLRMGRAEGGTPTTALRAQCGGGTEPVEDGAGAALREEMAQEDASGLAPEELELLEEEAMGGEDEGRSPTDYDRRAHIFEESSRVFRALKHRRDGDGGSVKVGGAAAGGHGD